MNSFRTAAVLQASERALNPFAAQTSYRLRYRFFSFETKPHNSRRCRFARPALAASEPHIGVLAAARNFPTEPVRRLKGTTGTHRIEPDFRGNQPAMRSLVN